MVKQVWRNDKQSRNDDSSVPLETKAGWRGHISGEVSAKWLRRSRASHSEAA